MKINELNIIYLRARNVASGLFARCRNVGFVSFIRELCSHHARYVDLLRRLGAKVDLPLRVKLIYEYINVMRFIGNKDSAYIIDFVPRAVQRRILMATNPLHLKTDLVNKIQFYRIMERENYSFPKVYFYVENGEARELSGGKITDFKKFDGFNMFCKDIGGSSGKGAFKIIFNSECVTLRNGYIYQEVVASHKVIKALAPVEGLSTLRIHSYLKHNDELEIQSIHLKLCVSGITDNIGTGGLAVPVNLRTGKLEAIGYREIGFPRMCSRHPADGIIFDGVQLPYGNEILVLVEKLHKTFGHLRSIGWDVAIKEDGPCVIEGNSGGDIGIPQIFIRPFYRTAMIQENIQ